MNRLRVAGTALAAVGAGLLGLTLTAAALPAASTTRTVAWVVTSGDFANRFGTPQTLYTGDPTQCGIGLLQVDVYRYDTPEHRATVDALVAAGILTSSAQDSTVYLSNQDVTLEACATTPTEEPSSTPAPTGTPTPSSTTSLTPSPSATSGPTHSPTESPFPSPTVTAPTTPSATPTPSTTGPATPSPSASPTSPTASPTTSSTPTHTSTSAPSRTSTATPSSTLAAATGNDSGPTLQKTGTDQDTDALAYTGSNPALGFGIGFAALLAGLILAAVSRRKGQES